jgi:hypothetical protein
MGTWDQRGRGNSKKGSLKKSTETEDGRPRGERGEKPNVFFLVFICVTLRERL